jgi:hypothetical protein
VYTDRLPCWRDSHRFPRSVPTLSTCTKSTDSPLPALNMSHPAPFPTLLCPCTATLPCRPHPPPPPHTTSPKTSPRPNVSCASLLRARLSSSRAGTSLRARNVRSIWSSLEREGRSRRLRLTCRRRRVGERVLLVGMLMAVCLRRMRVQGLRRGMRLIMEKLLLPLLLRWRMQL